MAGRTPGVTGYQLTRLKYRAWMYQKQNLPPRDIGRLLRRSLPTVNRWLAEIQGMANDDSLMGLIRETLAAFSLMCWTWASRVETLLDELEVAISIPHSVAEDEPTLKKEENNRALEIEMVRERYDLAVSYARRWEQKWEEATMIGWRAIVTAAAARGAGGQAAQFYYNSEEFYREIREYRRRVPLLAGQQPGLLESPEDTNRRLDEFMREHGTEILPSETL